MYCWKPLASSSFLFTRQVFQSKDRLFNISNCFLMILLYFKPGLANNLPVLVNKVLCEHNYTHLQTGLGCFLGIKAARWIISSEFIKFKKPIILVFFSEACQSMAFTPNCFSYFTPDCCIDLLSGHMKSRFLYLLSLHSQPNKDTQPFLLLSSTMPFFGAGTSCFLTAL